MGAIAALLLALVAAGAALVLTRHRSSPAARSAPPAAARKPSPARTAPTRSPVGLALGTPPLRLRLDAASDPIHIRFKHPPRAGILVNLDSGRVLWRREPERRVGIASLTKMMTALLIAERTRPSDSVLITPEALAFQGSGIGLLPRGKRVPLEALLYGLLLPSGNDAAIALAQHVAGSVPAFVRLMNARAARLGLACTRFASPSGFVDQDNYSCAADMAVLARADLAQRRVAAITGQRSAIVPFPIRGGKLFLYNNNPLVREGYPGITGLKTGYTVAAGLCLVETAERQGVRLAAIVLHSQDAAVQAAQLLDRGFEGVYHQRARPEPLIPPLPVPPRRAGRARSA